MAKNFTQLKAAIGSWLGVSTTRLPDAVRGDMINMVRRRYCRANESRFGEFSDTFQTDEEVRDYLLPDGWSKPRSFWFMDPDDGSVNYLKYINKDTFDRRFPATGLFGVPAPMGAGTFGQDNLGDPSVFTVWQGYIQLGLVPDRELTIYRNYWRMPQDLSETDPILLEDDFTKHAWEYLLFKALSFASMFGIEDERIPIWEGQARDMEMDLGIEHGRSETTGHAAVSEEPG